MQRSKERRDAISQEKLDEALKTVTDYLKIGWTTGGGRRLRQFNWSLWNGYHLLNLYDLSSGLDGHHTEAAIVIFHAAMVGALDEKQKRRMMKESGELARWERARAETPEEDVVIYPPFPMSTEELRRVAHSAEQFDMRLEQERRAEKERETSDDELALSAAERDQLPPPSQTTASADHPVRPRKMRDRSAQAVPRCRSRLPPAGPPST